MKKHKIVKKVLAMVGATAVMLSLGGAKVAEAACSHPVSSWKESLGGTGSSHWSDTHTFTITDDDTGYTVKYTCTRWYQMVDIVTYCGGCGVKIGNAWCKSTSHSEPICPSR